MQHGFKGVAPSLIAEKPGLSADDYARLALERHLCKSDSVDPVFSLASTLRKEVREGRMIGVVAKKAGGKICFYPSDFASKPEALAHEVTVQVLLPSQVATTIDELVELGRFPSAARAAIWLIEEGIRAKQNALDQISIELDEIRQKKQAAMQLI